MALVVHWRQSAIQIDQVTVKLETFKDLNWLIYKCGVSCQSKHNKAKSLFDSSKLSNVEFPADSNDIFVCFLALKLIKLSGLN